MPADAPNPRRDEQGFLRKALPMNMILAWSRQLEARHALFMFDSCFSGTVFKAKALPDTPPHITRATALPVRQYITAGDAGETVPAKSVFTPAFIDALEYGWGDLNRDGYVSGTELGPLPSGKGARSQSPEPPVRQDPGLRPGTGGFCVSTGLQRRHGLQACSFPGRRPFR